MEVPPPPPKAVHVMYAFNVNLYIPLIYRATPELSYDPYELLSTEYLWHVHPKTHEFC